MKIIQSFAKFEEGSPYMVGKSQNLLLNYYSFFLSYLTLKKYYGSVTMYCNKGAYDAFIKEIPYDEINIVENGNAFEYWNKYKVDVMKLVNDDFIHVDSDVFIFDDIFSPFIKNPKYEVIVQDVIPKKGNFIIDFYYDNEKLLKSLGLITNIRYDGRCVSCGTFGMKKNMQEKYFEKFDLMYDFLRKDLFKNVMTRSMILEELTAYLVTINNDFNMYEVLDHKMISTMGINHTANKSNYTHMWFNSKFEDKNIKLIKNKIKKDFQNQYHLIENFENNILNKDICHIQ